MAVISLAGKRALECLSDYELRIILRRFETSAAGLDVDAGGFSFRPYDPGATPAGNGFRVELRDSTRTTLLASGAAVLAGARAGLDITFGSMPSAGDTLELAWPDLSDTSVVPSITSQVYTFTDPTPPATLTANQVGITGLTGASGITATIDRMVRVINGDLDYSDLAVAGHDTTAAVELVAHRSGTDTLTVEARDGGTWGNVCYAQTVGGWATGGPLAYEPFVGGTLRRGIRLTFDAADLPNSLVTVLGASQTSRRCYLDIMGLDSDNSPTKIVSAPAELHTTATSLPA